MWTTGSGSATPCSPWRRAREHLRVRGAAPPLAFLLIVSPLASLPLRAQSVELTTDLGLTRALPPPGVTGPSGSYLQGMLRLRVQGIGSRFFGGLSGGASLAEGVGSWAWGTAGGELSGRFTPTLGWGVSLETSGFVVQDPTDYRAVALRLHPELRVRVGRGILLLGAAGGVGRSRAGATTAAISTDLWSAGGDLELRMPVGNATLIAGAGATHATAGTYGTGRVAADVRIGSARLRGELGSWRTPPGDWEGVGSFGVSLALGPSWSLWAGGGRSEPDALLGTPPGDFLGSGLSWRVLSTEPAVELPARVVDARAGTVVFEIRADEARSVSVAGDFSGWQEVPLERREGVWRAEVTLEPGLHHYGFLVDGEWRVPEGAPGRTEDEWGRPTATVWVPAGGGSVRPVTYRSDESSDVVGR